MLEESTRSSGRRRRTWLPMVLWSTAILAALGLIWFAGAMAVPLWKVRGIVRDHERGNPMMGLTDEELARLGGPEKAASALALYLKLTGPVTRDKNNTAFDFLRCVGKPAGPHLVPYLDSEDQAVRIQALDGIVWSEAWRELVDALRHPRGDVREKALTMCFQFRAEVLRGVLARVENPEVRDRAISYLGSRCSGDDACLFYQETGGERAELRRRIFRDFFRRGGTEMAAIAALDDGDEEVRFWAAFALGSNGNSRGVPILVKTLQDKDLIRRFASAYVLHDLKDQGSAAEVRAVLNAFAEMKDNPYGYATAAAEALARDGDGRGGPRREASPENQAKAAAALKAARGMFESGKTEVALAGCRESIGLDPNVSGAHQLLGDALAKGDKLDEAASSYREALRLEPGNAAARVSLGMVLARQGKDDEALACYSRVIQDSPWNRSEALHQGGLLMLRHGKLDVARSYLGDAARRDRRLVGVYLGVGDRLEQAGRPADAIALYREVVGAIDPGSGSAWLRLGAALCSQDKADEAVKELEMAAFVEDQSSDIQYAMARALAAKRDGPRAAKYLGEAIGLEAGCRDRARADKGFDAVREHPDIVQLLGKPPYDAPVSKPAPAPEQN